MTDAIEILVRLRRLEEDRCAAALAQAHAAVISAEAQLAQLADDRRREVSGDDVRFAAAHSDWLQASLALERRMRLALIGLREAEEVSRAELADRAGQRRAIERVAELRAQDARRATERKRQINMDAAAADRARRG